MGVALCTRTDLYPRDDLYLHTSEKMIGGAYLFSLVMYYCSIHLSGYGWRTKDQGESEVWLSGPALGVCVTIDCASHPARTIESSRSS